MANTTVKNSTKVLAPLGLIALVVACWWVAVATSRSLTFPTPGQIVLGIVELMQQGLLLKHVLASLLRVILGYLLAAALAIPLGVFLSWYGLVHRHGEMALTMLAPLTYRAKQTSPIFSYPVQMRHNHEYYR